MKIGRYTSISWGLTITGSRHPVEWFTTSNINFDIHVENIKQYHRDAGSKRFWVGQPSKLEKPYPEIGNDVWIGQNVVLNRGVKIGDGAIIAAYSLVTKDVEPYSIVGGNPAKLIRMRFPKELTERLIASQWWNLDPKIFGFEPMDSPLAVLEKIDSSGAQVDQFEWTAMNSDNLIKLANEIEQE